MREPLISIIIPTYNAEKYLQLCLDSIRGQDYPRKKFEVLIIDGGSTDKTLSIAKKYDFIKIIKNPRRIAEYGKAMGIKASRGEYFILIDSDNEIVEPFWLRKIIFPILDDPALFGVESPLAVDDKLTSLNRYLARLRIIGPVAKYFASKPEKIIHKKYYDIVCFSKNSRLVTGANGFLWNKPLLKKIDGWQDKFEEANLGTSIHSILGANYAIPKGVSIRHYYCSNLAEFTRKRYKIANKMTQRIINKKFTWITMVGRVKTVAIVLFCLSVIGPLIEAIYRAEKDRTRDWLWHPVICLLSIVIYVSYFVTKFSTHFLINFKIIR